MVAGYHLIWTAYGFWLPNDPRGSTSLEVRVEALKGLGQLHYGRKMVQPLSCEMREFFDQAREVLTHPVMTFTDDDILFLGDIFGREIISKRYTCYACAVMPDHVHLLIRRHKDSAEEMIEHFQEATRDALIAEGKRPPNHPVWTKGRGWTGFLNTRADFQREIEYIRQNPIKIGKPEQKWEFVKVYDGWLPGFRG